MEAQSSKLSVNDLVQARPGLRSVTAASPVGTTAQSAMGVPSNGPGTVVSSGVSVTCVSDVLMLPSARSVTPSQTLEVISPTESVKSALSKLNSESLANLPPGSAGESECQCGAMSDSQAHHFRRLLLLHLQVIERQQTLLQMKDSEIETLRADKEKLEVRMQRMERRISLVGRRESASTGSSGTLVGNRSTVADVTPLSPQLAEKRTASDPAQGLRLYSPPSKRRSDRHISESGSSCRTSASTSRASTPPAVRLPAMRESALSSQCELKKRSVQRPPYVTTTNEYSVTPPLWPEEQAVPGLHGEAIEVPSWREVNFSAINSTTTLRSLDKEIENLDDEVFLRRHYKCEVEEKRIKRWDLQRTRSLRVHENLLRRYEEKEQRWRQGESSDNQQPRVLTSFMPSVDQLRSIEITDELPVVAFGQVIPNLPECEFSLPWFDVEAREAEEEMRTTRSRARSRLQLD